MKSLYRIDISFLLSLLQRKNKYWNDYAHFVVHTGVVEKKKGRPECQNYMDIFGYDLRKCERKLVIRFMTPSS